jgi:hypothetical protein
MKAQLPSKDGSVSSSTRMRGSISRYVFIAAALALSGCGTPTMDLAGYPDAAHDRLYRDGRLGDEGSNSGRGLAGFDLRKAWRAVADTGGNGT